MAADQLEEESKLSEKADEGDLVDESLNTLMEALFAMVQSKKLQKIYAQIFGMLQRLVKTLPVRGADDPPQRVSGQFMMSAECRERILMLFGMITNWD